MSLKPTFSIILLLCCLAVNSFAQQEAAIWYFGDNAGLDFNSGVPVPLLDGQIDTVEGCATISDANGSLLFYTDGIIVWNRNHNVMPNGTGLLGDPSSTQSGIIVPKPNNTNVYYIFTVDDSAGPNGLNYSEVDMALNGGNGDVTSLKNIQLVTPVSEKVTAIDHANGIDFWVVTHEFNSNNFTSYLISESGVTTTPVISSVGSMHDGPTQESFGYMKISPNGERLALAKFVADVDVELFDFDNSTGIVSNPLELQGVFYDNNASGAYGIEFSPNNQLLYVSDVDFENNVSRVHQFDINQNSVVDILNSDTILYEGNRILGAIQLAIDQKMYVSVAEAFFIDVIENPNSIGISANYSSETVSLGGRLGVFGLPPFIQSFFNVGINVEGICLGESTQFSVSASDEIVSISWNFGDGNTSEDENPLHVYASPGEYDVVVIVNSLSDTTTLSKTIEIYDSPIANTITDYILCDDLSSDGFENFNLFSLNDQILNGQVGNFNITFHISEEFANEGTNMLPSNYENTSNPESIFARIENANNRICYDITSFEISTFPLPSIIEEETYMLCVGDSIQLEAEEGYNYYWSTGEATRIITVNEAGIYTVDIIDENQVPFISCSRTKTFVINASDIATIVNIQIEDWSLNNNIISVFVDGLGDYEFSLDNITYQDSNIFTGLSPDAYTVYIRDKNDCGIVSEDVFLLYYPKFFTPNGDEYNPFWQIINGSTELDLEVLIFDRYGKLIAEFTTGSIGWDGSHNGQDMPATDYWFAVKRPSNGKTYTGHFTLRR